MLIAIVTFYLNAVFTHFFSNKFLYLAESFFKLSIVLFFRWILAWFSKMIVTHYLCKSNPLTTHEPLVDYPCKNRFITISIKNIAFYLTHFTTYFNYHQSRTRSIASFPNTRISQYTSSMSKEVTGSHVPVYLPSISFICFNTIQKFGFPEFSKYMGNK